METRLRLKPGQNGTKKLVQQYGDRLVCVRYLYDEERQRRYKTVELIVDEIPWNPGARPARKKPSRALDDRVGIRVEWNETELREQIKGAGGIWRPKQKLWEISYAKVSAMGLDDRIVSG